MGKIYIQTCAYNAEHTLERCMDSVLNQTAYGDKIVYHVCDNGSTDNTGKILQRYAEKDPRIVPVFVKENCVFDEDHDIDKFLLTLNDDDYYCTLDSDDAYKSDFLEKMIPFIEQNDLDFGASGNDFIDALSGKFLGERVISQPLVLSSPQMFLDYFPIYHQFMRTIWAKVYTGRTARILPSPFTRKRVGGLPNVANGFDTLSVFCALRHSKRVGVYPQSLHRYYMKSSSVSRCWYSLRIESNQKLYEDAENYLASLGEISRQNREFLDRVYANAVSDSLIVLLKSTSFSDDDELFGGKALLADDKLKELRKITDYAATAETIEMDNSDCVKCKRNILNSALNFGLELKQENEDFNAILSFICPDCASFVKLSDLELIKNEPSLQDALFNNSTAAFVERILFLISKGMYSKQFDLFEILERFSINRGIVSEITEKMFIKKYGDVYLLLWRKKYIQALDCMTEILQKKRVGCEAFFRVYLTLAAKLESSEEFVIGKIKLAAFYCDEKRSDECCAILDELTSMGIEDNEEITHIKSKLHC